MVLKILVRCVLIVGVLGLYGCTGAVGTSVYDTQELAVKAYEAKDYSNAVLYYEKLVEEIPKDAEFWFKLGNAYAKNRQLQSAIPAYQNSLMRDPANEKAWYNMGIVQMQIALRTFIDMAEHTKEETAANKKGKEIRKGLMDLLQNINSN